MHRRTGPKQGDGEPAQSGWILAGADAAETVMSADGPVALHRPLDRPFARASVTKLLTSLVALDSVQRSLLDLDEPPDR